MARTAARIHDRHLRHALRPALERTGSRLAILSDAQVVERRDEWALRMPARPPGTQRVLEQEPDHVVLGEQLRHRPQVRTTDLPLRRVDLVLLVFLPELV